MEILSGSAKSDTVAVVVTYESAAVLASCLKALKTNGLDIIVVDNASADRSVAIAKEHGATVIANLKNEGYGRANNAGIRAATGATYCLVVNPDVVVDADLTAAFHTAVKTNPNCAIFGPRLIEPDGRIFFRPNSILEPDLHSAANEPPSSDCEMQNMSGACLFVSRQKYLDLGGFDENIFLFYEDDDLCFRARRAGWTVMHIAAAQARHLRGGSSAESLEKTYRVRFHQAWSRAYVCRKHGKRSDIARMLGRNTLKYVGAVLTGRSMRRMRYGGSIAGSWAALFGRSAIKREGLM